jgi:hypothetical protein
MDAKDHQGSLALKFPDDYIRADDVGALQIFAVLPHRVMVRTRRP